MMSKNNIVVIFAGGVGLRMGKTSNQQNSKQKILEQQIPKQFIDINGKPVIARTLEHFQNHSKIDAIYISCLDSWKTNLEQIIKKYKVTKVKAIVSGGKTSQNSIYNGLIRANKDYNGKETVVLVHDGVRPIITKKTIDNVLAGVEKNGNAVVSTPCFETIIISSSNTAVDQIPLRKDTHAIQAPQGFYLNELINAHEQIQKTNPEYTNMVDACTIYKTLGKKVFMVEGNFGNIKITKPEDIYICKALLDFNQTDLN